MVNMLVHLGQWSYFALRLMVLTPLALLRPDELTRQLARVLLGALPLAAVTGLAVGIVVWLHLHGVMSRFGPGYAALLPQALALAVVLEFAPLAAGFIVAGRTGAALGAELGAMRLTEQVDALEVLGISPLRQLAAPRVLACLLALPLLTLFMDYLALAGGLLAETLGGDMTWLEYRSACLARLRLDDVILATLKTAVFGFLVGTTGCWFGLTAHDGTEGVGQAATRAVVWSIFLVVIADVVLVRLIQLVLP
jgi:phospholipid/cholesterol/gamma-HCH transport system permease protein